MSNICKKIGTCHENASETCIAYVALIAAAATVATFFVIGLVFLMGFSNVQYLMGFYWIVAFITAFAHAALLGLPVYLLGSKHTEDFMIQWFGEIRKEPSHEPIILSVRQPMGSDQAAFAA